MPNTILVLLSKEQMRRHLATIVTPDARVWHVSRAAELTAAVAQLRDAFGVVVDTYDTDGRDLIPAIEFVQASRPAVPILVYTPLSPNTMRACIRLAKRGLEHIVLQNFDDRADQFRSLLQRVGILPSAPGALEALQPVLLVGSTVSRALISHLAAHPTDLYHLSPCHFEELVADLLARHGFDVRTTSRTRDGGKDIVVSCQTALGEQVYYVECKRYGPTQPVGVGLIRELYGVVRADRVTGGILATSSYFSKDALRFQSQVPYQLALRDHQDLRRWLESAANTR